MRAAAYHFSVMAAESATRLFAIADALDLLQRALANARNVERRVKSGAHGNRLSRHGRFAEALAAFEEALPNTQPARARDIRRELVFVHRDHGSRTPALLVHDLEELEYDVRRDAAGAELCRVLWAYRMFMTGPEQVQRAREAVHIAESAGAQELIAKAHFELGGLLMLDDTPEHAFPHLDKALGLYAAADDLLQAAQCHNFLAVAHVFVGKVKRAAAEFEQAAALFERVHSPTNLAAVLNNMGVLLLQTGEWGERSTC
jgi:tetratricopeptide (TPR) repeat protein